MTLTNAFDQKSLVTFFHYREFTEPTFCCIFLDSWGFSLRILLFGQMELDLPTPVSHPNARGTRHRSFMFAIKKEISKNKLNHFLKIKNWRKSLTNSLLATVSLSNAIYDILTGPMNSVSTIKMFSRILTTFSGF